jgi:hypothetical protein
MYEPIGSLRTKFRYAFIEEVILNIKTMLGELVFPMENTLTIIVICVYDNIANPSVSSNLIVTLMEFLRSITIEIIGYHAYLETLGTVFDEIVTKTEGKSAVMVASYYEQTPTDSVAAKCYVSYVSGHKR